MAFKIHYQNLTENRAETSQTIYIYITMQLFQSNPKKFNGDRSFSTTAAMLINS